MAGVTWTGGGPGTRPWQHLVREACAARARRWTLRGQVQRSSQARWAWFISLLTSSLTPGYPKPCPATHLVTPISPEQPVGPHVERLLRLGVAERQTVALCPQLVGPVQPTALGRLRPLHRHPEAVHCERGSRGSHGAWQGWRPQRCAEGHSQRPKDAPRRARGPEPRHGPGRGAMPQVGGLCPRRTLSSSPALPSSRE